MCNLNVLLLILLAPCLAAAPGDLDTTFNTNGFVLEDISAGGADRANALAVQPDGRIVVVGARDFGGRANCWIVARSTTAGSLGTTMDQAAGSPGSAERLPWAYRRWRRLFAGGTALSPVAGSITPFLARACPELCRREGGRGDGRKGRGAPTPP